MRVFKEEEDSLSLLFVRQLSNPGKVHYSRYWVKFILRAALFMEYVIF